MRSSASLLFLLALLAAPTLQPSLGVRGTAAGAVVDEQRPEHRHRGGGGQGQSPAAAESDALYWKVGKFAVLVYSLHKGISPVPELERVVSASERPARDGRGVEYLLVLRVARLGTCEALVWGLPHKGSRDWKLKDFKPAAHHP